MVKIFWLWQAQNVLQQALHAGGGKQVLAAHDVADALQRVVDDDGEMVAGRDLAARHDHIAPVPWLGFYRSGGRKRFVGKLAPEQVLAEARQRRLNVQPPGDF